MHEQLGIVELKSGEKMAVQAVHAPDAAYIGRIRELLAHKGGLWQWQIERVLQEPLGDLQMWYYVGQIGEDVVSNVCVYARGATGILGHVYTRPEHRRKRACQAIMSAAMEHYQAGGGRLMTLGTGYDSPPYHIYRSFGFDSVVPGSGFMQWEAEPGELDRYFRPGPTHTAPLTWGEWAPVCQLYLNVEGDLLRSIGYGLWGSWNFEGGFLELMKGVEEGKVTGASVLRSESGATVGVATLKPDRRFVGAVQLLDVFVHPHFAQATQSLVASLPLPSGKVQAYVDLGAGSKMQALEALGFEREAVLRDQASDGTAPVDVALYARFA